MHVELPSKSGPAENRGVDPRYFPPEGLSLHLSLKCKHWTPGSPIPGKQGRPQKQTPEPSTSVRLFCVVVS